MRAASGQVLSGDSGVAIRTPDEPVESTTGIGFAPDGSMLLGGMDLRDGGKYMRWRKRGVKLDSQKSQTIVTPWRRSKDEVVKDYIQVYQSQGTVDDIAEQKRAMQKAATLFFPLTNGVDIRRSLPLISFSKCRSLPLISHGVDTQAPFEAQGRGFIHGHGTAQHASVDMEMPVSSPDGVSLC